jgi:hypothetical protein
MEPETLLYIGGIADGERRLTKYRRTMIPRYTDRLTLSDCINPQIDHSLSCITQDLYRLERICGPKQKFSVMVLDSMDADQMIEALISKYPAPKNDD